KEINELFKDLLISVTNFFRDPEAFKELEKQIIPELFEGKGHNDQIRIWVIGCATGEEVYSLAILLQEYASKLEKVPQIKIFGTDISEDALKIARKGFYTAAIATDVSKKRLVQYFHKEDGGYRLRREIREMVLISKHNVISDPPFTKLDLISCRNLLIYFNNDLQAKVLRVLQYALKTGGFLFLGKSESTVSANQLFDPIRGAKNIYKTKKISSRNNELPRFLLWQNMNRRKYIEGDSNKSEVQFEQVHRSLLAEQYGPGSVIIDDYNKVVHFSKGINRYLQYEEGEPTNDLLKLVIPEIRRPLRTIIFRFNQMDKPQPISKEIKVEFADGIHLINLKIQPIEVEGFPEGYRQVVFEEMSKQSSEKDLLIEDQSVEDSEIVTHLETELKQTKEQLQQTIEEYETSNEELMASNEELQSMNEELQTTTEELETNQEELQSVNEELRIVNQELEVKIEQLQKANDDLKNLMEATEIGIIFVDQNLKIRRFTQNASELFNFIDSDVGRPLSDVTHQLKYEKLAEDVQKMLKDLKPVKKQLASKTGKWVVMQLRPYQTTENVIKGAVITFLDITDLKKAELRLEEKIEMQKQLQQDLLRVEKKDRWSIGQFLHDEVAQNLLSVKTLLDAKSKQIKKLDKETQDDLGNLKDMIIESLKNIRDLSHFVLPLSEGVENVTHALELLVKQTENVYEVRCSLTSDEKAKKITNNSLTTSIYYIVQEAISNAVKHGKASKISIDLTGDDQFLYLVIEDNGTGFESKGDGRGIKIMRYRTELLGGEFEVDGHRKNKGTLVKCTIPLTNKKKK
ncbi:MAG TPA: CheR family methyltransferase, partial [Balneolaceae bacterium]|nr:CheR family methyltransferase [Balneolaceae bacterium]